MLIPRWVGLCTFKDPVGLCSELSWEAGSFCLCRLNPHRCFQSEAWRLYFTALEPLDAWSVSLPSYSSRFICTRIWDCPLRQQCLPETDSRHLAHPSPPAAPLPGLLSARLPISAPPTALDECFFLKSLVVGLPYSLIFCQFCLFIYFFNWLLSFFWLSKKAQCVYLCLHLRRRVLKFFKRYLLRRRLTELNMIIHKALNLHCRIALQKMDPPTRVLVSQILVSVGSPSQKFFKTLACVRRANSPDMIKSELCGLTSLVSGREEKCWDNWFQPFIGRSEFTV